MNIVYEVLIGSNSPIFKAKFHETYKYNMLSTCNIDRLVKCSISDINNEVNIKFFQCNLPILEDINAGQISVDFIEKIFRSIDYLEKDLKGYMLDIDDIYIDEIHI